MKVILVSPQKDEVEMLPFFFRHYDSIVDEYYIYDNISTDPRTFDLYDSNPKVTVVPFDTGGKNDSPTKRRIRNSAWKECNADWVLVVDADELLFHPTGVRTYLEWCLKKGITYPTIKGGYEMVSEHFPRDDGRTPITDLVKCGIENWRYAKRCVFQPVADVVYGCGAHPHDTEARGHVVESKQAELLLLHYSWLSFDWRYNRTLWRARNLSAANIAHGWSVQLNQIEGAENQAREREGFETRLRSAKPII